MSHHDRGESPHPNGESTPRCTGDSDRAEIEPYALSDVIYPEEIFHSGRGRGNTDDGYAVLHGGTHPMAPVKYVHRGTDNKNGRIARKRGNPRMTKKERRKANQPGGDSHQRPY